MLHLLLIPIGLRHEDDCHHVGPDRQRFQDVASLHRVTHARLLHEVTDPGDVVAPAGNGGMGHTEARPEIIRC